MAIECCSTLSIAEVLCDNLTAYEAIRLYRVCSAIHNGNQMRREWWQHMESMICIATQSPIPPHRTTMSENDQTHEESNANHPVILSRANVTAHEISMGNDNRSIRRMPGTTIDQQW